MSLKLELTQHSGSFKARGAFANLLMREVPPAGVAAASGGNHGAAVAYAARQLGHKARIFVPEISSPAKIARIRGYGADLAVGGKVYAEALAACEAYIAETGALSVHAFDQVETMLGQGTVGLELERQVPDLDTLLVAVGGGGLIAGIAAWYEGKVKVVGVEPRLAPTLSMALAAGRPVDAPAGGLAADSLAPKRIGELVFPDRPALRGGGRAGRRRGHRFRPARSVGDRADRRRARRRRASGRPAEQGLCAGQGRARRHPRLRRQHDRGRVRSVAALRRLDAQRGLEPALDLLDIGRVAVAQHALAVLGCGEGQHVGTQLVGLGETGSRPAGGSTTPRWIS